MTAHIERNENNELPGLETEINNLIGTFDAKDLAVRMSYSRHLDRPHSLRMDEVTQTSSELFDSFSDILMFIQDSPDAFDEESLPHVLAGLISRMSLNHAELLAEYTTDKPPLSDEEKNEVYQYTLAELTSDGSGSDAVTGSAVDCFREVLGVDRDIIEQYTIEHASSPREVYKQRVIHGSKEFAKIGGSVIAAMFVYDMIKRA